jgi:hypothetical protein
MDVESEILCRLKTKIVYEAYPESQTEVDELVARFRLRRIIYDP